MVVDVLTIQVVQVLLFKNNVLLIDSIIDSVHGMLLVKTKHVKMQDLKMLVMINVQLTQNFVLVKLIMLLDAKIELVKMLPLPLLQILDVKNIFQVRIVSQKKMVDV